MSSFDKTHNPRYNSKLLAQITQKQMPLKRIVYETEALFEHASKRLHLDRDIKTLPSLPFYPRKDIGRDFSSFCKAFPSFGFK